MRFELAGSLVHAAPKVLALVDGQVFHPQTYIDQGYTTFDVMVIGGGGGAGGGIATQNTGTKLRTFGGSGGGGGLHRVQGILSALPLNCPVVVGAGGVRGLDQISDPDLTTDGGDGGASSFNDTTAYSSGGKGGKRVTWNDDVDVGPMAAGGDGGSGARLIAGGGGLGAIEDADFGDNGSWNGAIGQGGGGTTGGLSTYAAGGSAIIPTGGAGNGSYNPADLSVYGLGGFPEDDPLSDSSAIVPGGGGGAKATPLNGLPGQFGRGGGAVNGDAGAVIIRLTSV